MDHHEVLFEHGSAGHSGRSPKVTKNWKKVNAISPVCSRSVHIPQSLLLPFNGDSSLFSLNRKRKTKVRSSGLECSKSFQGIESARDLTRSSIKRRRRSYDHHLDKDLDLEPFPCFDLENRLPQGLSDRELRSFGRTTYTQPLSEERKTKTHNSMRSNIISLCSDDDLFHRTDEQQSYPTNCQNIPFTNTNCHLANDIRDRFCNMLRDTRLSPSRNNIRSLRSYDVVPASNSVLGVGTFSQVTKVFLRGEKTYFDPKRYACKQLKQELLSDREDFVKAATELAYEAYLLSSFDHPNIIKIHGMPEDGITSFGKATQTNPQDVCTSSRVAEPPATSFFLIMDLLHETLDQRIDRWNSNRPQSLIETRERAIEKISLCRQLASVLEHIHSKGIVYRDLKPQNIGFCKNENTIKLFDFGLCREVPKSIKESPPDCHGNVTNLNEHCRFKLSGMVGTIRYMAPEVCLRQPYNRDCDIYSWSIVSWEIWSQTKPFETFTPELYQTLVCKQGYRPTDDGVTTIPAELESLLKEAWKTEPHHRIRWQGIQQKLNAFQTSVEVCLQEACLDIEDTQHIRVTTPVFPEMMPEVVTPLPPASINAMGGGDFNHPINLPAPANLFGSCVSTNMPLPQSLRQ